jgi:CRP/FNR family cyclic AMP-dependent transcriptional regulator
LSEPSSVSKPSIRQSLQTNTWFSELPAAVLDELAGNTQRRQLKDGELLYCSGDEPAGLFGIVGGRIRICSTSAEGKALTATFFEAGDWLGEISIFDGLPRLSDAVAFGDSEVLVITRQAILGLLERQPELYAPFVLILCRKLRMAMEGLSDLMLLPLSQRLAKRLLALAEDYGKVHEAGVLIDLHLPQDELGRMLGTSRQSVSKELKFLERAGLVKLAYGQIIIVDREQLKTLLLGAGNSS